jgi:hypothetical protein
LSNQDASGGGATNGLAFRERTGTGNSLERVYFAQGGNVGIGTVNPGQKLDINGAVMAERYRGQNSLGLGSYYTVNPSSNVYLYSPGNDRDAWIYLDSADTGSNWGIYHRQIDSTVGDVPANSIAFVGGGGSVANAYINLASGYSWFRGGHNDLAENYFVSGKVLRGSLVSINQARSKTIIASDFSHRYILGVVSTTPGAVMDEDGGFKIGSDTKKQYENEKVPIALVGTAPALVTSQNGLIDIGDAIGLSDKPGFGVKMITAGNIVGKALEKLDASRNCQTVSSIDAIVWPEDDGKNSKKPCFKLPDGTYVGKIMVAVNSSWYDPGMDVSNSDRELIVEMRENIADLFMKIKAQQQEIQALKQEAKSR